MKRIILAAVLALGSLAMAGGKAQAVGFGNGGTYGISPGSISVGVGFNIAWSGLSFGRMDGGGGGAPCYGPPAGPQMYDAYGYGGHYGYQGYYGHSGYGYNGYNAYNGYPGYHYGPGNAAQAAPAKVPAKPEAGAK